jgi:hypothetical protein
MRRLDAARDRRLRRLRVQGLRGVAGLPGPRLVHVRDAAPAHDQEAALAPSDDDQGHPARVRFRTEGELHVAV